VLEGSMSEKHREEPKGKKRGTSMNQQGTIPITQHSTTKAEIAKAPLPEKRGGPGCRLKKLKLKVVFLESTSEGEGDKRKEKKPSKKKKGNRNHRSGWQKKLQDQKGRQVDQEKDRKRKFAL